MSVYTDIVLPTRSGRAQTPFADCLTSLLQVRPEHLEETVKLGSQYDADVDADDDADDDDDAGVSVVL